MLESFGSAGLAWETHEIQVPVDYRQPSGPSIVVFAREVIARERRRDRLPWLLWLQGGPGNSADRPVSRSPWLAEVLKHYRVLLLDQRGTGRSTPITHHTIGTHGSAEALSDYLTNFRADSIVRDAEMFRHELLGEETWILLGESYGGFCALTYMSLAPEGLAGVMISGGLPPLMNELDDVYRAMYRRVASANELYWSNRPLDQEVVRRALDILDRQEVLLPRGDRLSPRRFQMLGLQLGKANRRDVLHFMLESAFVLGTDRGTLSDEFLHSVDSVLSFGARPLYAILHEAIYCVGSASRWSADRTRAEFPQFDIVSDRPVFLTGEMIYPWLFDEDPELIPFRAAAHLLAGRSDWPELYNIDRLKANRVPVCAALYHQDMYVDTQQSLLTADTVRGMELWLTNEYEHDALWVEGRVTRRLLEMLDRAT